jgi:hypothetical protein
MVTSVVRFSVCSNCGGRLRWGIPRFGPETVICGHCGTTINTSLQPWAKLSSAKKFLLATSELIAPSYIGAYLQLGGIFYLLLNSLFWIGIPAGVASILIGLLISPSAISSGSGPGMVIAAGVILIVVALIWGALPIRHLYREIRSSNEYSKKGNAQIWKVVKKWYG